MLLNPSNKLSIIKKIIIFLTILEKWRNFENIKKNKKIIGK